MSLPLGNALILLQAPHESFASVFCKVFSSQLEFGILAWDLHFRFDYSNLTDPVFMTSSDLSDQRFAMSHEQPSVLEI